MANKRVKIMVVDDHAAFRQMVKTVLAPLEAEFLECEDGESAVAQHAGFSPDIVLMDISLKHMDGLKATAQIKTCSPKLPVLMLTQYDDADLREAAQKAGACAYVLKEDLSQLPKLLRAILKFES